MVLYAAPGQSATATNESFETSWLQGFNPAKAIAALQTLPKITLVAEVSDPIKFGRALDGAVIAMNNELKAKALEKAAEEAAEEKPGSKGAAVAMPAGPAAAGRARRARGPRVAAPPTRPPRNSSRWPENPRGSRPTCSGPPATRPSGWARPASGP